MTQTQRLRPCCWLVIKQIWRHLLTQLQGVHCHLIGSSPMLLLLSWPTSCFLTFSSVCKIDHDLQTSSTHISCMSIVRSSPADEEHEQLVQHKQQACSAGTSHLDGLGLDSPAKQQGSSHSTAVPGVRVLLSNAFRESCGPPPQGPLQGPCSPLRHV